MELQNLKSKLEKKKEKGLRKKRWHLEKELNQAKRNIYKTILSQHNVVLSTLNNVYSEQVLDFLKTNKFEVCIIDEAA